MKEDCAPGMSTPHGCNDGMDVVESFKEALKQRVGEEAFQVWFAAVEFRMDESCDDGPRIAAITTGQFAADRLKNNFLPSLRGAVTSVCGANATIGIQVEVPEAHQIELPFDSEEGNADKATADEGVAASKALTNDKAPPNKTLRNKRRDTKSTATRNSRARKTTSHRSQSIGSILNQGTDSRKPNRGNATEIAQPPLPSIEAAQSSGDSAQSQSSSTSSQGPPTEGRSPFAWENFVLGDCNQLARTACQMAIQDPGIASPLVLWGPPGCGKTHLLHAVAEKLRRTHRMRRVVYLSAEEFTNDFLRALNGNSLHAFRMRFSDADALLIDGVQFFVDKKATLRELHRTIETLAEFRKPLLFAGTKAPSEIQGLGGEISGRLSSGLVCQVQSLDDQTRGNLLSRYAKERCAHAWPEEVLNEIAGLVEGDGRVLSGIVNLVALLQQMYGKMPTMDQIRQHGSHLLRATGVPITLSSIERAVEKVFQLDSKVLQSSSQTKSVTEPRMLAMFLARELTSSAFSEIGGHFGGRSHSTAILANQRVGQWLDNSKAIGRGKAAVSVDEAVRRVKSMLKTG